MAGDNSVVCIGSRHQGRGIFRIRLDVVVGRIRVERSELLGIVRAAKVIHPKAARRKFMKAQHVHHSHSRQAGAEQFRTLSHASSDQQPTITPPLNGKFLGTRVLASDQPFGGGDEVVKNILLVVFDTRFVPLLTILTPATQVRDRKDATHFQPRDSRLGIREIEKPP